MENKYKKLKEVKFSDWFWLLIAWICLMEVEINEDRFI